MSIVDNNLKSFHVKGNLPQWAVWCIALVLFMAAWSGVSVWARATALRDLQKYEDQWGDDGILEQPTDYTCVPAAIVMLLTEQGFSPTLYEIADISGTDIRGTGGRGIIKTGEYFGFNVTHEHLTFDEFMETGLPAIIIFRYKQIRHAAYISQIKGYDLVRVKDSVQGLLHFERDGANDYFDGETLDCYLFERGLLR